MFARVSTYEVPESERGNAAASFRKAIAQIREAPGLEDAYLLLGRETEHAITITLWENLAAMAESRVVASRLRSEAAEAAGGDVLSVEEFEVVEDTS